VKKFDADGERNEGIDEHDGKQANQKQFIDLYSFFHLLKSGMKLKTKVGFLVQIGEGLIINWNADDTDCAIFPSFISGKSGSKIRDHTR